MSHTPHTVAFGGSTRRLAIAMGLATAAPLRVAAVG